MTTPVQRLAQVDLHFEDGVVLARRRTRDIAALLGFDLMAQTRIATAVSELARNAHRYAGGGQVKLGLSGDSLTIEVIDTGQGIADVEAVLSGNYRSTTGMGQGLIGVRRLMDSFEIRTGPSGTRIHTSKRLPVGVDTGQLDSRQLRIDLARTDSRTAFDEVLEQNQELLQALGELRSTQDELLQLNVELEDTNQGVVALYAELDDRAEQLRDADSRKTRFLADMSHELRTPLNSIIGLTELLTEGADPLTAEQRMQVEYIHRMASDQLRLVGELLDIAKIEAGRVDVELHKISVPELFSVLRIQLRPLLSGSEVVLRFVAEPELPILISDEQKLIQIMRNLISNAVKYTRRGEIIVTAAAVGETIELTVQDTGVGIPEDALDRIFDEFVQVAGEHQRGVAGTGLGLPLTRKLAQLLGGTVTVTSTVGKGSEFVVALPWRYVQPAAYEAAGDRAVSVSEVVGAVAEALDVDPAPVVPGGLELVVIADDDPLARQLARRELEPFTGELVEFDGGEPALAFLAQRRPAVLVLDLSMGDLSGFEVLDRVRLIPGLEQLPVVIHTSRELTAEERTVLEREASAIVAKDGRSTGVLAAAVLDVAGASTRG